jgi:hypothetical protein
VPEPRYEKLAAALMAAPDPVRAIASLLGDHEARLDGAIDRIIRLEAREKQRRGKTYTVSDPRDAWRYLP